MAQNPSVKRRVGFQAVNEQWSEYKLDNGATLKTRAVVVDVLETDARDPFGFPIYIVKTSAVVAVHTPVEGSKTEG